MNEKILNQLDDDELLYFLSVRFGTYIPEWKKCSKKEYDKYDELSLIEKIFISSNYKKVPVYKNFKSGILWQIENFDKKPDYYKYYKQVNSKFVLMIGSEVMNYLTKRNPYWLNQFLER